MIKCKISAKESMAQVEATGTGMELINESGNFLVAIYQALEGNKKVQKAWQKTMKKILRSRKLMMLNYDTAKRETLHVDTDELLNQLMEKLEREYAEQEEEDNE